MVYPPIPVSIDLIEGIGIIEKKSILEDSGLQKQSTVVDYKNRVLYLKKMMPLNFLAISDTVISLYHMPSDHNTFPKLAERRTDELHRVPELGRSLTHPST